LSNSGSDEPKTSTNGAIAPVDVIEPQVAEAAQPPPQRDLGVTQRLVDVVRDVGDAPGPAADLEVLRDQRAAVRPRADRVAIDRDEQRDGRELAVIVEERPPVEPGILRDRVRRPVPDLVRRLETHRVRAEADEPLGMQRSPHLDVRAADGDEPRRQWHVPQVVVEHRHRLEQPMPAPRFGGVAVREIAEVRRMHAEVRVEIGDDDRLGVVPELAERPVQPAAAVRHGARLADDDARLERVEDVEEVPEPVAEDLAQTARRSRGHRGRSRA
jgi:hypothetical protein